MATNVKEGSMLVSRTATRVQVHQQTDSHSAPFSLRCAALIIDYILLAGVVALSTVIARMLGDGTRAVGSPTQVFGVVVAIILLIVNYALLAGLTGQTIGKFVTGLKIEKTEGGKPGFGRVIARHFLGYPMSCLTLGFGFILAALNSRGRALHDMLSGTVVVRKHTRRLG
jgi:uncharacterized RDD family membrane protein YckC